MAHPGAAGVSAAAAEVHHGIFPTTSEADQHLGQDIELCEALSEALSEVKRSPFKGLKQK